MTAKYQLLFSIGLLHDYYSNGACRDFVWIPDEATRKLLTGYQALCKTVGNSLLVLIKTDKDDRPYVPLNTGDKFTFYLHLMNPHFMTVSSIGDALNDGRRFYFTNTYQNKINGGSATPVRFLSQKLPGYQAATTYQPGQLVEHNNAIFENIKTATGITPPAAAHWASRTGRQYASHADVIHFLSEQTNLTLPAQATTALVELKAFDIATNTFSKTVFTETQHFQAPVTHIAVNFNVPAGKYQMLVNGSSRFVFVGASPSAFLGVAEIFHYAFADTAFDLLDVQGKVKTSTNGLLQYQIQFTNRLALWKYITRNKGVNAIQGSAGYSFAGNAAEAEYFVSAQPIPLQEKAHDFKLDLKRKISTDPPPAPNPDIYASGMLSVQDNNYYCNIYLNY